MKPSGQISHPGLESDLEFALETQSGFLVVVKGVSGGKVTLTVRRRVGTPPSSGITLGPDEVKRLINLLGELAPAARAAQDNEKVLVGKARDAYLDNLVANQHLHDDAADLAAAGGSTNPSRLANSEMSLFMERDFPELANRRKRVKKENALGEKLGDAFADLRADLESRGGKFNLSKLVSPVVLIPAAIVVVGALTTVAVLNFQPFAHHDRKTAAEAVPVNGDPGATIPAASIEDFSKNFVQDMLTFKVDSYRQAQVRCMAQMSPELAQKYWQETGFPIPTAKLKAFPQDQQVNVVSASSLPVSPGVYQVDVEGSVTARAGGSEMPLHIRLTVNKDAGGKYTVSEQKDMSTATSTSTSTDKIQ